MADSEGPVTFIKKRKGAPSGLRKKPTSSSSATASSSTTAADDTPAASEVIHAAKRTSTSHLIQGTGSKRRKTEDLAALSSDEDEKADERQSYAVRHASDRKAMRRRSSSPPAWVSSEQRAEMARDKNAPVEAEVRKEDGLYHGAKGEKHQLPKAFGPVKGGPANVRTITLTDYQPDVCKDYKETGFCGFGDTCKFLHDRGDYMHGWQLDNSFLSNSAASGSFMAKQQARDGGGGDDSDSDSDKEDLPFACLICRKPFGPDPVVTLCGHYFDSACAIKRFAKTGKCFACGASTNGVFNRATKLIAKQKEREELNKQAREEESGDEGEGVEIEGLGEVEGGDEEADLHTRHRRREARDEDEEEEEEEEDDKPKPQRKRPIIEIV
ncbi:hypothetical protein JCM8547_009394 [Rhodosporidiobolus lusitaniae]